MSTLPSWLESIGVLIVGLALRLSLLLVVLGVLTAVFLVGLGIARAVGLLRRKALGVEHADGILWRQGLHYASTHTWLDARGEATRVGLDDLAQRLLPGLCRVKLPQPGTVLVSGEAAVEISCGDKHVAIPSPVGGKVVAINRTLTRNPSVLRRDPYARGWLYAIEPTDWRAISLRNGEAARAWLEQESHRLTSFFEHELGLAAADGGELLTPAPRLLRKEQWDALTASFLGAAVSR
jgi:glycine cleavage system H lipoate-binding protein